jgi:excisionase family DNA binding protein
MQSEFLTVDGLSEYLLIKKSTLYSLVERGDMPHYRIGKLIRFKKVDADAWMEGRRKEPMDIEKKARTILKSQSPVIDVDRIVKKSLASVKDQPYTSDYGKPDQN